MDAQKISEAASTMKKAEYALGWFQRERDALSAIRLDTKGQITSAPGHGEAKGYLQEAMRKMGPDILTLAKSLAEIDIANSKATIRQEAGGGTEDGGL